MIRKQLVMLVSKQGGTYGYKNPGTIKNNRYTPAEIILSGAKGIYKATEDYNWGEKFPRVQ